MQDCKYKKLIANGGLQIQAIYCKRRTMQKKTISKNEYFLFVKWYLNNETVHLTSDFKSEKENYDLLESESRIFFENYKIKSRKQ